MRECNNSLSWVSSDSTVSKLDNVIIAVRFAAPTETLFPQGPGRLWNPCSLLLNGSQGLFIRGKATWMWSRDAYSCIARSCASTFPTRIHDSMLDSAQ